MYTITDKLIVVSDIHLKHADDERALLLLEVLAHIDPEHVRFLVLLGDIFDFCFGASRYFQRKFIAIGEQLSRLSQAGVRVLYVQGNHEFSLEEMGWPGVEVITSREVLVVLDQETTIALTHGDRLRAPWHYFFYLWLTRSRLFRVTALCCPQRWLDGLCLRLSAKSREHGYTKALPHRKIMGAMARWLAMTGARHGIVGHFHVPYNFQSKTGQRGRLLGLDSWDKPNILSCDGQQFYRYKLERDSRRFARVLCLPPSQVSL